MILGLCLTAFLATCFLTYLIRRYALAKSLIDIPNARSSHSIPTPRGGGLSVVLIFLLFATFIFDWNLSFIGLIASCLLVAGIGFWDDHSHIPARWRLSVHFSAALIALFCLPVIPNLAFFSFMLEAKFICLLFYTLTLVWLLNLYNFMDGIDGIASVEAINVCLSAVALLFWHGQAHSDLFSALLLLAAAVAGFLVWNFPHAKIFMGDACSGFLGFILGVLAIMTAASGAINLWSWFILLGLFITDAKLTLIRRILTGEVWYEAHSIHAYQHYSRKLIHKFQQDGYEHRDARTKSHRRVNLMLTLINVFWLLPLAAIATFYPYWAFLITVMAYLPLFFIANQLKAGITE